MQSLVKMKSSRNGEITCHILMMVNHVIVANFYIANMSFNTIRENKILMKISELTVYCCLLITFAIKQCGHSKVKRTTARGPWPHLEREGFAGMDMWRALAVQTELYMIYRLLDRMAQVDVEAINTERLA